VFENEEDKDEEEDKGSETVQKNTSVQLPIPSKSSIDGLIALPAVSDAPMFYHEPYETTMDDSTETVERVLREAYQLNCTGG
jgi:hypothetical protein